MTVYTRKLALLATIIVTCSCCSIGRAQNVFFHWETPHVHPLEMTGDGRFLTAVNIADGRLEVFRLDGGSFAHVGSVPTGVDPVSVRARTGSEVWVVNHISDSISVVDLETLTVTRVILTADEPADVVFAKGRAFVTMSQLNEVHVYDPASPESEPVILPIAGEDPRALATDGQRVYAAIFESGNHTTILSEFEVSETRSPYGGQNPPPNGR